MVTETVVGFRVVRPMMGLMKVQRGSGYQLVCGGRLVSERTEDGRVVPHADLPPYTRDMFPCDFDGWCDATYDGADSPFGVSVTRWRCRRCPDGEDRRCWAAASGIRIADYLFEQSDPEEVRTFVRRAAECQ